MTPQRFNDIEALAFDLLEDARYGIEDKREIYDAIRDCLLALLPHVTTGDPFSTMHCRLPAADAVDPYAANPGNLSPRE